MLAERHRLLPRRHLLRRRGARRHAHRARSLPEREALQRSRHSHSPGARARCRACVVADLRSLTEPRLSLPVEEHDRVLTAREDDVEVAAVDPLLRPPPGGDAPPPPPQPHPPPGHPFPPPRRAHPPPRPPQAP